ncbi:hypothetical protein [Streptomyces chryseus]|uniref:hypothetical protein n=1 Tax=Streptomyces chryseus TaxID=68186 RepID=UPI00110F6E34|nr:hypothetical protein [Streptomyces chryseus]
MLSEITTPTTRGPASSPHPLTGPFHPPAQDERGSLKAEIGTTVWESHEAARADVFRFIEVEYNRTRLRKHPVYGYVTPLETRALTTRDLTPAA